MFIVINNELLEVQNVIDDGYLPMIETDGGDFYFAECHEDAGEAVADYYREMANNNPEEFTELVGKETLVSWCLGQYAGPGNEKCNSLEKWFEIVADYPKEHWASYDGNEIEDIRVPSAFLTTLGFASKIHIVAYRCN